MRNYKIIYFLLLLTIISCGKSPLLNKVNKITHEVSGGLLLTEQFPSQNIDFSFKWITPPTLSDLSSFELSLGRPLSSNQTINAYLYMPDMGHGSSPIEIKQLNPTDYIFSELAFIMPGLWVLHIEILENNQVIDKWQKSFTL